ncbi:hypothetical protein BH11BAC5_BH11BAC5_20420 [soil metagenome]
MIKLKLACSWDDTIKKLLEAEPQLSPEDINFKEGEDDKLVGSIAKKLNRSSEQVTGWIESVSSTTAEAS